MGSLWTERKLVCGLSGISQCIRTVCRSFIYIWRTFFDTTPVDSEVMGTLWANKKLCVANLKQFIVRDNSANLLYHLDLSRCPLLHKSLQPPS